MSEFAKILGCMLIEKDVFKSASDDEVVRRQALQAEKRIEFIKGLPKVDLYAMCQDQLDTWVGGKIGTYSYNVEEDVYYDANNNELEREDIVNKYIRSNFSTQVDVQALDKDQLIMLRDSIDKVIEGIR